MHTLDLDAFKYSGTNITGMRLVKPHDSEFQNTVLQWTDNLSPLEPDDKTVLPETIQVRMYSNRWLNYTHVKHKNCYTQSSYKLSSILIKSNSLVCICVTIAVIVLKFDTSGLNQLVYYCMLEVTVLYLCTVGVRSDLRCRAIVHDVYLQSEQRFRNQRDPDSVQFKPFMEARIHFDQLYENGRK